jgi:hypothetical protein
MGVNLIAKSPSILTLKCIKLVYDASDDDGDFKHAQLSLEFEHKRRNVQSEDDV